MFNVIIKYFQASLKSKTSPRNRQCKLAPRFAKQKENCRLNQISDEAFSRSTELSETLKSASNDCKFNETNEKLIKERIENNNTGNKSVPNAWVKPLSHSLQTTTNNSTVTTTAKPLIQTSTANVHEQALSVSSKSSSFDQHDSGIDVSDQPPSTASSQRSSPSNEDNKLITTTAKANGPNEDRLDIV